MFTIPGKREWTVIINSKWQQHLASEYDQKEDIVRIKVKPKQNKHTERLQYFIEQNKSEQGQIAIALEKIKIDFPVMIKN